jgi:TolB protein
MDVDGNNPRQLTNTSYNAFLPAWSPGNSLIAFVFGNELGSSIYVTDTAGGNISPLINRSDINASMPAWSPDGTHLAYVVWDTTTYQSEIYVSNADGSRPLQLTHTDAWLNEPTWSPDGAWLAFSMRQKDQPGEHIMVISSSPNAGVERLLPLTAGSQTDTKPAWGK